MRTEGTSFEKLEEALPAYDVISVVMYQVAVSPQVDGNIRAFLAELESTMRVA